MITWALTAIINKLSQRYYKESSIVRTGQTLCFLLHKQMETQNNISMQTHAF